MHLIYMRLRTFSECDNVHACKNVLFVHVVVFISVSVYILTYSEYSLTRQ